MLMEEPLFRTRFGIRLRRVLNDLCDWTMFFKRCGECLEVTHVILITSHVEAYNGTPRNRQIRITSYLQQVDYLSV
jgi:hypothetical protein